MARCSQYRDNPRAKSIVSMLSVTRAWIVSWNVRTSFPFSFSWSDQIRTQCCGSASLLFIFHCLSLAFVVAHRKLAWNCGRRSRHYVSPRTSFVLRRKQLHLRVFFTNFEHEFFSRCLWVICELCSHRSSRLTLFILLGGREGVTSRIIKHRE